MGKYFGREPRYSQAEAEAQAQQAIDAAVSRGRPPAEEWRALEGRMGEINRELATRPRIDLPPPPPPRQLPRRPTSQVLRPQPGPQPAPEATPAPADRKPVVKRAAAKKPPAGKPAVKEPAVKRAAVRKAPATKAPAAKRAPAKKRST